MTQRLLHKSGRRLARPLALTLALLSLIFLLQVTPHGHANGHDEAACRLCQAAHVSSTPAVSGIVLSIPLVPVGETAAPTAGTPTESFFSHSDPRAPPVEVLL
jgi:hypothetical protein